jgi:hypothetical protein
MITLKIDSQANLYPLNRLPGAAVAQIKARLTFPNPAFLDAERRGFYAGHIPREIRGYRQEGNLLTLPRGFTGQLIGILRGAGVRFRIEDRRRVLPEVEFTFHGKLHDFQEEAVEAMAARDFGTLAAPTGSGKTVMALHMVARRRQPTIIVVHTKELADQWVAQIGKFLGIPAREVGIIGGGKKRIGSKISVALVQSLYPRLCSSLGRYG